MEKSLLSTQIRLLQPKMHGLAVGATIAIGSTFLSQGCPLVGQCVSCGACLPRLPLLAIPLAADAIVLLAGKLMGGTIDGGHAAESVVDPGH